MSNIERTVTLTIPDSTWEIASLALREIRKIHQDAGGHSKLRKDGETITFTAAGSTPSVLQTMDAVRRIGEMCKKSQDTRKQKIVDGLKDAIKRGKQNREDSFLGALADELLKRKKS
jgi:hypothetical protein